MHICVFCGLSALWAKRCKLAVGFHQFPTKPAQRQAWEDFCSGSKYDNPAKSRRTICSDHFEEDCFRIGGKRVLEPGERHLLKDGAIPTIREGTSLKNVQQRLEKMQQRNEEVAKTESHDLLEPIFEASIKTEEVCRNCASEDTLYDLTLEENAENARRFSAITSIVIDATAPWLCSGCLGRLNDAYGFVQACTEAENRRKSLFVETLQIKQEEDLEISEDPMMEFKDNPAEQAKGEENEEGGSEEDGSSNSDPESSGSKLFTCETCQATFEKRTDLFAHVKTHGKSRFPCKLCDHSFRRKASLVEHMFSHKIEPSFFCEYCSAGFKNRTGLQRHRNTLHLGLKPFGCAKCGKQFAQKTHLQVHAAVHVKEATIPCNLCNKMFKTEISLRVHVQIEHKDNQPLATFECDVCSERFSTKQTLVAHRTSHREPNLLCTVCGNKYTTNILLAAHMKAHKHESNRTQRHACEQCTKSFLNRKSLRYHQLVHAGLKPFKCKLCDSSFRCVTHLKTHQSVHTGVKAKVHTGQRKVDGGGHPEEEPMME